MAAIYTMVNYEKMRFLMYHKGLRLVNSNVNRLVMGELKGRNAVRNGRLYK